MYHPAGLRVLLRWGTRRFPPSSGATCWSLFGRAPVPSAWTPRPESTLSSRRCPKVSILRISSKKPADGVESSWRRRPSVRPAPRTGTFFVEWVRSATDPLGSRLHPTHIAEVSEEYGVDRKTRLAQSAHRPAEDSPRGGRRISGSSFLVICPRFSRSIPILTDAKRTRVPLLIQRKRGIILASFLSP